jgi:hypothetical protein
LWAYQLTKTKVTQKIHVLQNDNCYNKCFLLEFGPGRLLILRFILSYEDFVSHLSLNSTLLFEGLQHMQQFLLSFWSKWMRYSTAMGWIRDLSVMILLPHWTYCIVCNRCYETLKTLCSIDQVEFIMQVIPCSLYYDYHVWLLTQDIITYSPFTKLSLYQSTQPNNDCQGLF